MKNRKTKSFFTHVAKKKNILEGPGRNILTKGHTQSDDTDTLSIYVYRDTVPSSVLDFAFV